METLNLELNKKYTYADYLTWIDDKRRELINGFVKLMTPAPSRKHQRVSTNLVSVWWNFLRDKQCEVYHAPSDVRFLSKGADKSDKSIDTVVQPDIYVVCDLSKLDDKGCIGAPDLIIEIISPKNVKRDVKEKFDVYQKNGVREYWIVNPEAEYISVFILDKSGNYQLKGMYAGDDKIPVNIFDGKIMIDLNDVF